MKVLLKRLLYVGVLVAMVLASWYFRPWSEYSPSEMASLNDSSKYVENFRSMAKLLPYRTVGRGKDISRFDEIPGPLEFTYNFNGELKTLEQFHEESTTTSLVVVKDGAILHERYFNGGSRESLFTSWSVAKSFVATAIAIAHQEGLIESLDDPAQKYAPQFADTDFGASSIRGLLAMTSGIEFNEDYFSDDSDIRPFFFDSFVLAKNPDELLVPFKRSRAEFADFHYISSNTHILSAVLRALYNKPLADIIAEKIWQPLGMEADATWLQHRAGDDGVALGYCCLNARSRDYARFGQFYLDAYLNQTRSKIELPENWAKDLTEPASPAHKSGGELYSGRGYSYHFWLPPANPGVFFAAGVYGQYIWIDPARNLVIVRTSADPEFIPRFSESALVFEAIASQFDALR